jgi:hypothetical protein
MMSKFTTYVSHQRDVFHMENNIAIFLCSNTSWILYNIKQQIAQVFSESLLQDISSFYVRCSSSLLCVYPVRSEEIWPCVYELNTAAVENTVEVDRQPTWLEC